MRRDSGAGHLVETAGISIALCAGGLALLLSLSGGRAQGTEASQGNGGEAGGASSSANSLSPSSGKIVNMVDADFAYAHIESLRNDLLARWKNDFALESAQKYRMRLGKYGLSDADQAILLNGLTVRDNPWSQIADDFYARNLAPLGKSLADLRVKNAPSHVDRADLDAMDAQMQKLLAVEPKVLELADTAANLDAQAVAVQAKQRNYIRTNDLVEFTFGESFGEQATASPHPLVLGSLHQPPIELQEDIDRRTKKVGVDELYKLASAYSDLTSKEQALIIQYRTMQTQFLTELGHHGAPATSDDAAPQAEDIVPPDADPD